LLPRRRGHRPIVSDPRRAPGPGHRVADAELPPPGRGPDAGCVYRVMP
jgi:hypothetical protein